MKRKPVQQSPRIESPHGSAPGASATGLSRRSARAIRKWIVREVPDLSPLDQGVIDAAAQEAFRTGNDAAALLRVIQHHVSLAVGVVGTMLMALRGADARLAAMVWEMHARIERLEDRKRRTPERVDKPDKGEPWSAWDIIEVGLLFGLCSGALILSFRVATYYVENAGILDPAQSWVVGPVGAVLALAAHGLKRTIKDPDKRNAYVRSVWIAAGLCAIPMVVLFGMNFAIDPSQTTAFIGLKLQLTLQLLAESLCAAAAWMTIGQVFHAHRNARPGVNPEWADLAREIERLVRRLHLHQQLLEETRGALARVDARVDGCKERSRAAFERKVLVLRNLFADLLGGLPAAAAAPPKPGISGGSQTRTNDSPTPSEDGGEAFKLNGRIL